MGKERRLKPQVNHFAQRSFPKFMEVGVFDALPANLKDFRIHLGVDTKDMAELMGVPLKEYLSLEAEPQTVSQIHVKTALMASIVIAARSGGYGVLTHDLVDLLKRVPR